ncbi:hypothetical protein NK913_23805, partial [Salmonella enterica subsp. enterica serovar Typhimurium]|uniref:hypothetical protein n=1 Tax=Salmonella enterica TaxID=28901 RepID=UPI0020A4021C
QLGFGHLMGLHSDLFSLGVTFYECITDLTPYDFDSESPMVLEQAQLSFPLEKRRELPADWHAFLSYLCQKPQFKKPHRMYSLQEQEELVQESIA